MSRRERRGAQSGGEGEEEGEKDARTNSITNIATFVEVLFRSQLEFLLKWKYLRPRVGKRGGKKKEKKREDNEAGAIECLLRLVSRFVKLTGEKRRSGWEKTTRPGQ